MAIHRATPALAAAALALSVAATAQESSPPPTTAAHADAKLQPSVAWMMSLDVPGTGGWEMVSASTSRKYVYLTTREDVSRSGSIVSLSRRTESRDPFPAIPEWGGTLLSMVERLDVDCDKAVVRIRSQTGYRGRNMTNAAGGTLTVEESQADWEPAPPGTANGDFVHWACTNVSVSPAQTPNPGPAP
jgi:hypothetical protein